jgi:hypothetical protein
VHKEVTRLSVGCDESLDQMSIGIEEGWLTAPKSSGELSPPLNLKSKTRTIDLINEDRGSAYLGWGESHGE